MNEPRFWLFFLTILDLHNLSRLDQVKTIANQRSNKRWQTVEGQRDYEQLLLKMKNDDNEKVIIQETSDDIVTSDTTTKKHR